MNCVFLDEAGAERPMVMGCYGIGITRTVAAVIEQNYDADGIIWPWPVAPYHVHLVSLDSNKPEIAAVANQVENDLEAAGFRGAARRSRWTEPRREIQGRRSARHAAAADGGRQRD